VQRPTLMCVRRLDMQTNDPAILVQGRLESMLCVDQILAVLIPIPCSLIGFPVVGSCREIALIGLLCTASLHCSVYWYEAVK
jgi:hypothetical protein